MDEFRNYTINEYNEIAGQPRPVASGPTVSPQKLQSIVQKYPWLSPETTMSLARYNASDAAIDIVGQQSAMRELDSYEQKLNTQGDLIAPLRYVFDGLGWVKKGTQSAIDFILPEFGQTALKRVAAPFAKSGQRIQTGIKGSVRWISAAADIVPETVQNLASMAVGSSDYDLMGLWESTSLAVMLENFQETGSGYFMSQTLREEQAKRARAFRGTIYSNAFTIGRGLTSWAGENSLAYKYASGIIDAAVLLAVPDPTKYVARGIYAMGQGTKIAGGVLRQLSLGEDINKALKAGGGVRGLVPTLSAEDAKVVKKAIRAQSKELQSEAGLIRDIAGQSVDGSKFVQFMKNNPLAIRLIDKLVEEDSAKIIMDDIFRYEISNETAAALARAKTSDQVISALTDPFTLGENTLNANIGRYRVNQPFKYIRQSRFFTEMPKQTIVTDSDDPLENVQSVRNMILSMRTAGVSEDKIGSWADKAIVSFSSKGTKGGRKDALTEYDSAITEILRANKIEDRVIEKVLENSSAGLTKMREYYSNRMGVETDNGHLRMMMEILGDNINDKVVAETIERTLTLGDEIAFAGPATISQMLSRVRTLPDTRELRRLTRNPLFQKLFNKIGLEEMGKLPIAGRRAKVEVERYANPARAEELKKILAEQRALPAAEKNQYLYEQSAAELQRMTTVETVRTLTGDPRRAIDLIDFLQNRIWKPLNLATVGYVVRNGIDAQIRMAFGGARSLANGGVLHPLEFIHIAIGLPGKGTKYGKSITGVDLTNLGVAKRTLITGEIIPESIPNTAQFIYVGERRFNNNAVGIKSANKYAKRTGKPVIAIDEGTMLDDVTARAEVQMQLREGVGLSSARVGFSPLDEVRYKQNTGNFMMAQRGAAGSTATRDHTRGMIYNLQDYQNNQIGRMVARGVYEGKTDEQIAEEVADWLLSNKGSPDYRNAKSMHRLGRTYKDAQRSEATFNLPVDFDEVGPDVVRQVLKADVLKVDIPRFRELTGNIEELKFAAAYDAVPELGKARAIPVSAVKPTGPGFKPAELKIGQRVQVGDETGVIVKLQKGEDGASDLITFVPFREDRVLTGYSSGKSSAPFRQLIENKPIWDGEYGVPNQIRVEQQKWDDNTIDLNNMVTGFTNWTTGWLFNGLNDFATRRLERSPLFRQYYYQEISKHVDRLSYEEGKRLYENMMENARQAGYDNIRQYLGEGRLQMNKVSSRLESLNTRSASSAKGTLTIGELDDYARFKALGDTKDLLYDASTRNNFFDALRIVMPFADAWKDVIGTYMMLGARHNVHMIRQFARVYNGIEEADPDQDGRGFFFRQPQTGEVQFSFPMSGSISKLVTGIDAPLAAPVARLSQGINIYPALGPYSQFGLSSILSNDPKYNDIKELFLPYGETKFSELFSSQIPGVYRKAFESFVADTENRASTYGNVYIETVRALSVNPKYDLSSEQGVENLLSDARFKARILTGMRMMSQFLGPSAGTQEWKIPTKLGDQYITVLLEELRKFQRDDYDTSIDKFLNLYGEELALYVSSKSKALRDGLEATQEFGDWTALNQGVLDSYQRVGAYFGPTGSDFNFTVWNQQQEEGEREKLGDKELIKLAQFRIGSTKYRAFRRTMPPILNAKQRSVLASFREVLHEQFPGFPVKAEYTVGEFDNSLVEIREALTDKRLANNPIMGALREYMQIRDGLELGSGQSLKSRQNMGNRGTLYSYGEGLALQNPEFARIWDRLLSQEVEQ
jgi:hypothetical protein